VLIAGVLQLALVAGDAEKNGFGLRLKMPKLDEPTRKFLKALGPAIIGAGGVQLALFADTIIATFLPTGALSALYYADRIHQLPIGVVGIAVGTVLLPEMARRLAAGDEPGAARSQGRAIEFALLLAVPCAAASLVIPELIMRALFARGAFTAADAAAAGQTLAAYATGLIPFVLMRSFVAPFHARGDTATPVIAALSGVALNIALKVALMGPLAQVGLALGTAAGAWLNLLLLIWFARRREFARPGEQTLAHSVRLIAAGIMLGVVLFLAVRFLPVYFAKMTSLRDESLLLALAVLGGVTYFVAVWALLGRPWLKSLLRSAEPAAKI
jgi:putative peptidoglycan lipid II flippase